MTRSVLLILILQYFISYQILLSSPTSYNLHEECKDSIIYTVQSGDFLIKIAKRFGDARFWESIYVANANYVDNPHLIYPGQKIKIPANVGTYLESDKKIEDVLENPFCKLVDVPLKDVKPSYLILYNNANLKQLAEAQKEEIEKDKNPNENDEKLLEDFREAFETLVEAQEQEKQRAAAEKRNKQVFIEVDGMILDNTISKMGRDFYDIFYQYWQAPDNAYNYTIQISEQPAPTLGTMVSVKINDNEMFRTRLQPRYDTIETAGQQAVRVAYNHIANNKHQYTIY